MKNQRISLLLISLIFILAACEKGQVLIPPGDLPFADESIDDGKRNLEAMGIEMIGHMRDLRDSKAIEKIEVIYHFLSKGNLFEDEGFRKSAIAKPLDALYEVKEGGKELTYLYSSMKADEEDFESIQEIFDEYVGVYSWDNSIEDWTKTSAADRIEFKFPATENGTTNNASIVVLYKGTEAYPSPLDDYTGDLPVSLKVTFTAAGTKLIDYDLTFAYTDEGIPSNIKSTLIVSDFSFNLEWVYSTKKASVTHSMKKGSLTLANFMIEAGGDLSRQNIEDAIDDDEEIDKVLHTANGHFQILNIKIIGNGNVKAMIAAERSIFPDDYWEDENFDRQEADRKLAKAFNKNFDLIVIYADKNQKIADAEFYQYTETYWWGEESRVDIRFVFADNSRVDLETYFGAGFSNMVKEMNAFISEMNDKYDLDLENIEYDG